MGTWPEWSEWCNRPAWEGGLFVSGSVRADIAVVGEEMTEKNTGSRFKMAYVAVALIVLAAAVLSISVAFANRQADRPAQPVSEVDSGPLAGPPPAQDTGPCNSAFLSLVPEKGAPANGGSVTEGDRLVLDLVAHSGQENVTAAQAYMSFSYGSLRVVNADATDCAPATTVTADPTTFDVELQNEVCNGPQPCTMRSQSVEPGSIAYATGALNHCPNGCTGDIRAARIAFCATKTGEGAIRWQFTPQTRQTALVDIASNQMSKQSCYADYKISIKGK